MATGLGERLVRAAKGEGGLKFDPTGRDQQRLVDLDIDLVQTDPDQPRKDLGELAELADSIREQGVIQPIIVEAVDRKAYRILAGERRHAAAKKAGLKKVPCVVRTVEAHRRLELQLIENIHRKELNPVEEAESYERLRNEFNYNQRELAKHLGKSVGSINETLRILGLPDDVLTDVRTSEQATKSVLLVIAKEASEQRQRKLWQRVRSGELTVRGARKATRPSQKPPKRSVVTNHVISTKLGRVTLHFEGSDVNAEDHVRLLEAALAVVKGTS